MFVSHLFTDIKTLIRGIGPFPVSCLCKVVTFFFCSAVTMKIIFLSFFSFVNNDLDIAMEVHHK